MDRTYRVVNAVGRLLLRLLGVRVRLSGLEHLPTSGAAVLVMNHASFLDFVLAERAAVERSRFVRFLCRRDVWAPGPLSSVMDAMQHVPVDREAPAHAYLLARRRLRAGEVVGIFPEAGISWSYTVRSLMPGAAALAAETGVPVIPVAMWGAQRIWTVGQRPSLRRGRVVDVRVGPALHVEPDADVHEVTQEVGRRLTTMLESLQRLPEHRPVAGQWAPWYPAHLGGDAPSRAQAADHDSVPRRAVVPSWGPGA